MEWMERKESKQRRLALCSLCLPRDLIGARAWKSERASERAWCVRGQFNFLDQAYCSRKGNSKTSKADRDKRFTSPSGKLRGSSEERGGPEPRGRIWSEGSQGGSASKPIFISYRIGKRSGGCFSTAKGQTPGAQLRRMV